MCTNNFKMDFLPMRDFSAFCEHLSDIRGKFQKWDSCERTVALYYLMSGLPFANARFLQYTLEHCITSVLNPELIVLERNANDPNFITNLQWERPQTALHRLLTLLPLLKPGNRDLADRYLVTIRKVLHELITMPNFRAYNDCIELMSYMYVHSAFNRDDKKSFKLLIKQLVNNRQAAAAFANNDSYVYQTVNEQSSDDSVSPNTEVNNSERMARRSNSLTPAQSDSHESLGYSSGVWSSQENLAIPQKPRSYSLSCDPTVPPAPLTSSSSDTRLHDMQQSQQPISKGIIFWLKSLRLHKYSWVFSNLNYEQMIALTDEQLQAAGITKGARHKLLISIAKLRERSAMLSQLETEVINGGDLSIALRKLKTILQSPLQTNANEDLPSQFVKVMGKVCTQLLMVRHPSDDCVSQFTWLCDRAETLDAFNSEQKRRLGMWKSQLCRAGLHTTSNQRNNYSQSHNRHGNKSNYYGTTNKFQSSTHHTNNGYNNKSSSYPNMHMKQQQPCSTRTSLNNLCPPPICSTSTSTATNPLPGPLNVIVTSSSPLISPCPPPKPSPCPGAVSIAQQVRFNTNNLNANKSTTIQPSTTTRTTVEQHHHHQQSNNHHDTMMMNDSVKSVDIESSLENLCLQMMEHALGP